jgi:3-oxoacyl-[acyl-carrier-protein] synthase-3
MVTDAKAMLVAGEELFKQTWEIAKQCLGWSSDSVDIVVPHQVSKKVLARGLVATGLTSDQWVSTFPYQGNVSAASVGIALSVADKEGRLQPGKRVALVAYASGLNCVMAEVMW